METTPSEPVAPTLQLSLSEEDLRLERIREEAVAEIHAKAGALPENKGAPLYSNLESSESTLLTPEEIAEKTREMKATSNKAQDPSQDSEILAKQRKMNELRKKGGSHYDSAVNNIENQ